MRKEERSGAERVGLSWWWFLVDIWDCSWYFWFRLEIPVPVLEFCDSG